MLNKLHNGFCVNILTMKSFSVTELVRGFRYLCSIVFSVLHHMITGLLWAFRFCWHLDKSK